MIWSRDTFKGKIDIGVVDWVGEVFTVRPQYEVREFHITLDDISGFKNCRIGMQLSMERVKVLDESLIGKKVEVWYFINGVVDKNSKIHNVLNCVDVKLL